VRFASPAEVAAAVGQDLGPSRAVTVDQNRIDGFAAVTEDRQWIHTDPDRAAQGPYGSTIAHGYLTLSLVSVFLEDLFEVDGVDSRINYGLNSVRFPAPVQVGSVLRASGTVLGVREKGDGMQVNLRVAVEREGGVRPVCVAEIVVLLVPTRSAVP
jgi:acyl dehydratase